MRPEGRPAHVRTGIILNDLLIYSDGHIGQGSDSGTDSERKKEKSLCGSYYLPFA